MVSVRHCGRVVEEATRNTCGGTKERGVGSTVGTGTQDDFGHGVYKRPSRRSRLVDMVVNVDLIVFGSHSCLRILGAFYFPR